ncbi:hypothetical protein H920_12091 [Fukomys damarensis]|uniref:Uncharacterized protein n=1 Tax=Fukomys damarensis TaxID=885580 RepID=A0A091D7P5_FUKDA|nr:hypothetical protein H920_12091 [Fukomys damarensis]
MGVGSKGLARLSPKTPQASAVAGDAGDPSRFPADTFVAPRALPPLVLRSPRRRTGPGTAGGASSSLHSRIDCTPGQQRGSDPAPTQENRVLRNCSADTLSAREGGQSRARGTIYTAQVLLSTRPVGIGLENVLRRLAEALRTHAEKAWDTLPGSPAPLELDSHQQLETRLAPFKDSRPGTKAPTGDTC